MKRREAKSPVSDEQLDLPFDRRPKATRTNHAEPLAVRIPDAVSSVVQFSAKVGFENSLVGGPFISFYPG